MSQLRKQVTHLVLLVVVATPAMLGHGLHLLTDSHDHSRCCIAVQSHASRQASAHTSASYDSCSHSCCDESLDAATVIKPPKTAPYDIAFTVRCHICDFLAIAQLRANVVAAESEADKVCSRQLPPTDAPVVECVLGTLSARGPPILA